MATQVPYFWSTTESILQWDHLNRGRGRQCYGDKSILPLSSFHRPPRTLAAWGFTWTLFLLIVFAIGFIRDMFCRYMDKREIGSIASHTKIMVASEALTSAINGAICLAICAAFLQELWHPFWAVRKEKNCNSIRSFLNSFVHLLLRRFIRQIPILIFFLLIGFANIPPGTLNIMQDIAPEDCGASRQHYDYIKPPFSHLSNRICLIAFIIGVLVWPSIINALPYNSKVSYNANVFVSWPEYLLTSTLKTDLEYPLFLHWLSQSLNKRFNRSGSVDDLLRATEVCKHALMFPSLVGKRSNTIFLACLLRRQFERTGSIDTLNQAIVLNEDVLAATPRTDKYFVNCFANLAILLKMRSEVVGSPHDFGRAMTILWDATRFCNEKPRSGSYFRRLMESWKSPPTTESTDDVDIVIASNKMAIESLNQTHPYSHPGAPFYLEICEVALRFNFAKTGSPKNLDKLVGLFENAMASTPQSDMNYSRYLQRRSHALLFRYSVLGDMDDLVQALKLSEQTLGPATQNDPKGLGEYLWVFGLAQLSKFDITDCRSDIERAVTVLQAAEKANNPYSVIHRRIRADLAKALTERCNRTGSTDDIDQSIAITSELVESTLSSDPARISYLKRLSRSLYQRYQQIGSATDDLHQSFLNAKAATELSSLKLLPFLDDLKTEFPTCASDLSLTLIEKFRRTARSEDLNNAIQFAEQTPSSASTRKKLSLAEAFVSLFDKTDSINDLDKAIAICEEIQLFLDRTRGRRIFVKTSTVLASALVKRYNKTGSIKDIELAIGIMQSALSYESIDHPDRAAHLDIIGNCFHIRFVQLGDFNDLHSAIEAKEQAFSLSVAPPIVRLKALRLLFSLLLKEDRSRARELLKKCIHLLPSISPRVLNRSDQQYNISQVADLTSKTVSLCLELGDDPYEALGILEMGRGFIANLLLEERSDVSDLKISHPELSQRFEELRGKLNQPYVEVGFTDAERRRNVAKEFEKTLSHIRSLVGLERFLLSPSESELLCLAASGPIVVFNISEIRSDAILITSGGIKSIQLPLLTHAELEKHCQLFMNSIRLGKTSRFRIEVKTQMAKVLEWLWDSGVESILDELQLTEPVPDDGVWPRIWWIGSGLLNLLPVHAAGYHDSGISKQNAMDRVVSSYCPSLRSLIYARQNLARVKANSQKAVFVCMPETPGQLDLPYAKEEADILNSIIASRNPSLTTTVLSSPTRSQLLSVLEDAQVIHLACHAIAASNPSESKLLLADWESDPLTVLDLSHANIRAPKFAFLAACHSATSKDDKLLDESIHLSSALHISGYPAVVGTLGLVSDKYSMAVAEGVYSIIMGSGDLDIQQSSQALHHICRDLRSRSRKVLGFTREFPSDPSIWALHIHIGV